MTTPSTELARYGGPSTAVARASLPERMEYAEALARAGLLPEAYRQNPANVLLAIEKSEALGIHHMIGIESIHIIKGKSTLSAELMRALIQRAGHMFDLIEQTPERAVVECSRRERPDKVFRHEWTIQEARVAELTTDHRSEERWRKYAKGMLAARVTSEAGRAHFADVLAGMVYTPEEMGAEVDGEGRIVDVTATATVHPPAAPAGPPVRTEDEQAAWAAEWGRRLADAATLEDLAELGRVVRAAERSGHCPSGQGDTYRTVLRSTAAGLPASAEHLTRMHAALTEAGVTERDDRRTAAARIVGRRLESTKDLTCSEADQVWQAVRDRPEGLDLVTGEVVPEGVGVPLGDTQHADPAEAL